MIGKTIAELTPGDHAELTRVVEDGDIAAFVDAVGDYNPVHSDRAYAATTPFKAPIAPGIFTAGLISAVIGTQLPGPGANASEQTALQHHVKAQFPVADGLEQDHHCALLVALYCALAPALVHHARSHLERTRRGIRIDRGEPRV